jgi:hypothetical protein
MRAAAAATVPEALMTLGEVAAEFQVATIVVLAAQ